MTQRYALQQVGVLDGTVYPPLQADGRQVNAKTRTIVASKALVADQTADTIVLGKLPVNAMVTKVLMLTSATLGSATVAIGIAGSTGKYRAAAVFTTPLNVPTVVGPPAAAVAAGPVTAEETIIATIAAAALAGTEVVHFIIEYVTNN